jgi:hypothetical protein
MPLTWSISHEDRLVSAAVSGEASGQDLQQYMAAVVAAGGMPYRKLFDATYAAPGSLRLSELRAFAKTIVAYAKEGAVGPLAIVVGSDLEREMAELFGQADAGRALGIFSDVVEARQWLDKMA